MANLLITLNSFCFTVLLNASSNCDEQVSKYSFYSFFYGEFFIFCCLPTVLHKIRPLFSNYYNLFLR